MLADPQSAVRIELVQGSALASPGQVKLTLAMKSRFSALSYEI